MTVAQQARDAAAIIKAMGADQAVVLEERRCYHRSRLAQPSRS